MGWFGEGGLSTAEDGVWVMPTLFEWFEGGFAEWRTLWDELIKPVGEGLWIGRSVKVVNLAKFVNYFGSCYCLIFVVCYIIWCFMISTTFASCILISFWLVDSWWIRCLDDWLFVAYFNFICGWLRLYIWLIWRWGVLSLVGYWLFWMVSVLVYGLLQCWLVV